MTDTKIRTEYQNGDKCRNHAERISVSKLWLERIRALTREFLLHIYSITLAWTCIIHYDDLLMSLGCTLHACCSYGVYVITFMLLICIQMVGMYMYIHVTCTCTYMWHEDWHMYRLYYMIVFWKKSLLHA